MVQRIYVEKKPEHAVAAAGLLADLREQLGLPVDSVRIINRYDIAPSQGARAASLSEAGDDAMDEATLNRVAPLVFFEPPLDETFTDLEIPVGARAFAIEPLPGQFDQRASSAAECVQLITQAERPAVQSATVYLLTGALSDDDMQAAIGYVLNPVDSRLASLAPVASLRHEYTEPAAVETLTGFSAMGKPELAQLIERYGLAMTPDDLAVAQEALGGRDVTRAELAVLDAYWSDHCRHTTFSTALDDVRIDDPAVADEWRQFMAERTNTSAPTLMAVATAGQRAVELAGGSVRVDESEEINACTVPVSVDDDGSPADWLLLFKNETHNHPTELEPFGGAATCIGGAIRDPLAGRGRVYQAMRVTGAGDPTAPISATLPGKLPQRRLTQTAAAGFSSYGNQVGLATGLVHEMYHPGYVAKRLECGAVLAAVPAADVRRERPASGDVVLLIGGRTGRDGIGGASGSSKAHEAASVAEWGAQVQKGDAPTERKLRRLFDNPQAIRLIKRCNDFGAGGVCVAIGELADGVAVDLDAVPKKYDGLDGTELAVSESQERMAVVVDPADADSMVALARTENLEATAVAVVTDGAGGADGAQSGEARLVMTWRGQRVVDLPRALLNTGGAERRATAHVPVLPSAVRDDSGDDGGGNGGSNGGLQPTPRSQAPSSTPGLGDHQVWAGVCGVASPNRRSAHEVQQSGPGLQPTPGPQAPSIRADLQTRFTTMLSSLEFCNRQGLAERFDSTIGAGTVLMPFGGVRQRTPTQTMVALLPTGGPTTTCSGMADGFNPYWTQRNPFEGAFLAVCDSVAKLVAAGFSRQNAYLTLQEFFPRLGVDPDRWGQPLAALLGALKAQRLLKVAAIGGKDSMSGTFENLDVPPTLISFAVATGDVRRVVSPEFKRPGTRLMALRADPVADPAGFVAALDAVERLTAAGVVSSAWVCGAGGLAEALFLGAVGNGVGVEVSASLAEDSSRPEGAQASSSTGSLGDQPALAAVCGAASPDRRSVPHQKTPTDWIEALFDSCPGTMLLGLEDGADLAPLDGLSVAEVGRTIADEALIIGGERLPLSDLEAAWDAPLSSVFPRHAAEVGGGLESTQAGGTPVRAGDTAAADAGQPCGEPCGEDGAWGPGAGWSAPPSSKLAQRTVGPHPTAWVPVFPGTNCENDTARALTRAGADVCLQVINNLTPSEVVESARLAAANIAKCQMVVIPGGFSGGDEPDGSAKLIASFLRGPAVAEALTSLLDDRDGLVLGICNGFQALVKLGLVPYGRILPADASFPTLTFNLIGRHQSMLVHTRVASTLSPWLAHCRVGDVHTIAVSHGEGRFVANAGQLASLGEAGQIAAQYVDLSGTPTMATPWNPNGSAGAVEALTSPDGRVLGKMGHSERSGQYLYRNVLAGDDPASHQPVFEAGVAYFA